MGSLMLILILPLLALMEERMAQEQPIGHCDNTPWNFNQCSEERTDWENFRFPIVVAGSDIP